MSPLTWYRLHLWKHWRQCACSMLFGRVSATASIASRGWLVSRLGLSLWQRPFSNLTVDVSGMRTPVWQS